MGARAGAGVGAGVQASKTALRIHCKLSSEYLEILVAVAGALATRDFVSKGSIGWSDNSSFDSGDGEELRGAREGVIEEAAEGAIERHSRRGRLWP